MLTSRAGDVQAIGQRLQKKLPYGGRAERTRAFKKANLAMTVLFLPAMWLAGGGVKSGITIGSTDEIGYFPTEDRIHVHDLQATVLHLMGLDHLKLAHRFQGRDFRLTDVGGKVVDKLLA